MGTLSTERILIRLLTLALIFGFAANVAAAAKTIMVFAPHPDDETLMAAGIIQAALARGDTVKVIVVTNGDSQGGGTSLGLTREGESVSAMTYLGLDSQSVIFLGYGDGLLMTLYNSSSDTTVYTSIAGQTQTYANQGLGSTDYHNYLFGSHGSYSRATIIQDIQAVLANYKPDDIYVNNIYDNNPDHQGTGLFVDLAIKKIRSQGGASPYSPKVHQTIVHAPCEHCDPNYWWPMPTFTPTQVFPLPPYLNTTPLQWSQTENIVVPANMQTTSQTTNVKYQAINKYQSQVSLPSPTPDWLFSFVKENEFFWLKSFGTTRYDFTSSALDPTWTFINPRGDAAYSLSANPGHLQINVPAGATHDCGSSTELNCARVMRAGTDDDATYETRIDGVNISTQYQSYGILLWQDSANFIRFEFWTGGGGVRPAAWKIIGGTGSNAILGSPISLGPSNGLRVTRNGNIFTLDYSTDGGTSWTTSGSFNQGFFTVNQAGLYVDNDGTAINTTANFGYLTITGSSTVIPPTVSVTAPLSGSTVSSNVTVSASASSGVVGVQFKIDGANLGSEITSSPYSSTWNTTSNANGSHLVTAVARDAAGTQNSSNPVSVSVSNAPGPPVISNVAASGISSSGATITWTTDQASTSQVEYGTTAAYGNSTPVNSSLVTSHSAGLSNLTANTLYHYRVKSANAAGLQSISGDFTFTTTTSSPPSISNVAASNISASGATITWTTDQASTSQVEYGTTAAYGNSTPINGSLVTSHSVGLSNLAANTLYHYRVKSANAAGLQSISGDFIFSTSTSGSFRDDFTSSTLDPSWTFVNPGGDAAYSLTANPGHLQISVPTGSHDCWSATLGCVRMMRAVSNNDATYETMIDGININASVQAYGLFLWQDNSTFIRFEFWANGGVVRPTAWTTIGGTGSNAVFGPAITLGPSNSLRVTRSGSTFTLAYSMDGGASWTTAGSFSQAFVVNQAGLHVDNAGTNSGITANFKYFAVASGPPVISNLAASGISPSGATITWTTNQAADSQVDYGLTTAYNFSTPLDTTLVSSHSVALAGLSSNTLYHYRVKSKNGGGNLATSGDFTFTTTSATWRDDFTSSTLDPNWSFADVVGNSSFSLTADPGHLQVNVPAGSEHDCWNLTLNCARMLRNVSNTDAIYETKIDGVNIGSPYQAYGMLLQQDNANFMRFEFWTNGSGVHPAVWKSIGGSGSSAIFGSVITLGSSNYLRVTRTGSTFKLEYNTNGSWVTAGSFTQAGFSVNKAGLYVDNSSSGTSVPATTANFNYFQIQ